MRNQLLALAALLLLLPSAQTFAVAQTAAESAGIVAVIEKSADDWNRGDLEAFVQCYEQSPETTFVGTEVSRGTAEVLSRYQRAYPDPQRMGKTTFSELQARPLTAELAIVTGRFHLQRDAQSGGDKSGLFTLVMRKGADGWRIIHDHTSADN
jgi:uncharacterized protein (TIGR02246 family)